jgi:AcrR family transcriptional regulator
MESAEPATSIWLRRERAAVGRPAQHSRSQITTVALDIADREGLDAVSMRRVAAELGTGAASLYRYVATRDELLDLMTDATAAEYELPEPTGDWLAELVAIGEQTRAILRRHRWLAALIITRPVIGPNGVTLIEHVLTVLAPLPASLTAKFEAFAALNGITASSVLHEQAGGGALQERHVAYLMHAAASGEHPRLARLLAQEPQAPPGEPADRYPDVLARILVGLLDHPSSHLAKGIG